MKRIVAVEPRSRYGIWIRFEDGVEGEIDLSDLAGKGVFKVWEDPREFQKVFVDTQTDTVAWPGGIDLCPDSLYEDLVGVRAS